MNDSSTLMQDKWSNAACMGYAIAALENLDYKHEQICQVVTEMREVLDWVSVDEAQEHYSESSY